MSAQPIPFPQQPDHVFITDRETRRVKQNHQQLQHVINRMLQHLEVPDKAARSIAGIHGALNGREKLPAEIAHKFVARQLHFHGKEANSDTFMCRALTAISQAEIKCGRRFFAIKRADGEEQIITRYDKDYIGEAALWALTEAKNSAAWRNNPAVAIDELIADACAKLPVCPAPANISDSDTPAITDGKIIKGCWTHIEKLADANLERIVNAGGDPVREVQRIQARLMKLAIRQRLAMLKRDKAARERDDDAQEGSEGYGYYISDKISSCPEPDDSFVLDPDPPQTVGRATSQVVDAPGLSEAGFADLANPALSVALDYASQGIGVIPLFGVADGLCDCRAGSECKSAGKHPLARLVPRGVKDATTDPATITRWFEAEPHANLGVAMGGALRLLALDSDPRNGGDASISDLVDTYGADWLQTFTVKTGGLGQHFIYRLPEGVEIHRGSIASGVDVKAAGGYLVAPPSVHVSGRRYEVQRNIYIAEAPAWLLEELNRPQNQPPTKIVNFQERRAATGDSAPRVFREGERNNGLRDVSCGYWMNWRAEDEADLIRQLLEVNAARCVPPLETPVVVEMAQRCARKFPRSELRQQGGAA